MRVTTMWNTPHDAAFIKWDYRHGHAIPVDPINRCLSLLYNEGFYPWIYVVWDGEEETGVLVTPTLDLEDSEVLAIARDIEYVSRQVPGFDEWKVRTDEVLA